MFIRVLAFALAGVSTILGFGSVSTTAATEMPRGGLDARGKIHIPIGIADTLDTLKTFVEAEGNFSPGVGSHGIYFWAYDKKTGTLTAPTMDGVPCEHGLAPGGLLIPWSKWEAGDIVVRTEVCHVRRDSNVGQVHVVGARAILTNADRSLRSSAALGGGRSRC